MRFYTKHHRFYCGIDLHARTMYVCIMDHEGTILTHQNLPAATKALAGALGPYKEDLVLAVECIFTWYWLADLCAAETIPFVLGHALYMKAIHGAKTKNDRIDAQKIAALVPRTANTTWPRSAKNRNMRATGTGSSTASKTPVSRKPLPWT